MFLGNPPNINQTQLEMQSRFTVNQLEHSGVNGKKLSPVKWLYLYFSI